MASPQSSLDESQAAADPISQFRLWFDAACASGMRLPEAMTLATSTRDGRPSARLVLLKCVDERGFVFYSSYKSRKARELEDNPRAALTFHWADLERQVRIEGSVERVSADESDAYFATRPRGSQIGAWTSQQSAVAPSREAMDAAHAETAARFGDRPIPRPSDWGGYLLRPEIIEFWQGRPNRLHDRLLYSRQASGWIVRRLWP